NNEHVKRMKKALEREGINVYAPRAGRFLDIDEVKTMFGIFTQIIGRPERQDFSGQYKDYHDWLDVAEDTAKELMQKDERLERFINVKKEELKRCKEDYIRMLKTVNDNNWTLKDSYVPQKHKRILTKTPLISQQTI